MGVKLVFKSPTYLNNLSVAEEVVAKPWTTPGGEELEINTENWTIFSSSTSASITDWFVNETAYQMTTESGQAGFEPLSQTFAVSMVGQLFPKDSLIKYIQSISAVYSMANSDGNKPDDEPKKTDIPNPDNAEKNPQTPDDGDDFW